MPSPVDKYHEQVKKDNPSYTDAQAWATAWSIYCKNVNPGSPHCKRPPSEYLKGKEASDPARDFEDALIIERIASQFIEAKEFSTPEEMKKYFEDHPKADKSKHHLKMLRDFGKRKEKAKKPYVPMLQRYQKHKPKPESEPKGEEKSQGADKEASVLQGFEDALIIERVASMFVTREVTAGHLSWEKVSDLARKLHGHIDKTYKEVAPTAQDTKWIFEDEDDWRAFVKELQQAHMNIKSDPKTKSVVVWF